MRQSTQQLILASMGGLALWLWFTQSGRALAAGAGRQVSAGVTALEKLIRGERNNNPGNIRISSTNWVGKIPLNKNTDGAFEQFDVPENGIRALGKVLLNYSRKYGLKTVRGLINRWAPPVENDTGSYVNAVASALGVGPDTIIIVSSPTTLFRLTKAIIRHENGRVRYSDSLIQDGVSRALA